MKLLLALLITVLLAAPARAQSANMMCLSAGQWVPCSVSAPLPTAPAGVSAVNRGATIVTGGIAVTIAANTSRRGGWIMNPCDATERLFISLTTTATTTSGTPNHVDLPACGSLDLGGPAGVYQGAVSLNATTSGHKFEAVELQ